MALAVLRADTGLHSKRLGVKGLGDRQLTLRARIVLVEYRMLELLSHKDLLCRMRSGLLILNYWRRQSLEINESFFQ